MILARSVNIPDMVWQMLLPALSSGRSFACSLTVNVGGGARTADAGIAMATAVVIKALQASKYRYLLFIVISSLLPLNLREARQRNDMGQRRALGRALRRLCISTPGIDVRGVTRAD